MASRIVAPSPRRTILTASERAAKLISGGNEKASIILSEKIARSPFLSPVLFVAADAARKSLFVKGEGKDVFRQAMEIVLRTTPSVSMEYILPRDDKKDLVSKERPVQDFLHRDMSGIAEICRLEAAGDKKGALKAAENIMPHSNFTDQNSFRSVVTSGVRTRISGLKSAIEFDLKGDNTGNVQKFLDNLFGEDVYDLSTDEGIIKLASVIAEKNLHPEGRKILELNLPKTFKEISNFLCEVKVCFTVETLIPMITSGVFGQANTAVDDYGNELKRGEDYLLSERSKSILCQPENIKILYPEAITAEQAVERAKYIADEIKSINIKAPNVDQETIANAVKAAALRHDEVLRSQRIGLAQAI